jgi:N utilization substance protein B
MWIFVIRLHEFSQFSLFVLVLFMSKRVNSAEDHPAGKFANRSMVRIVVFQLLYQEELNPGSLESQSDSYLTRELPRHEPLLEFAKQLLQHTIEHREAIDEQLTAHSRNWSLARMSPTDRSILRLATAEILYTDTPKPIVINEAVELAKKFGTNDSVAFVNGILDKVNP